MFTVAVWGTTSPLGRRVITRLASSPDVSTRVLEATPGSDAVDLADVDALVVLGPDNGPGEPDLGGTGIGAPSAPALRSLLEGAAKEGVGTIVVVSSATVYGARAGNPVPLTEEAPLRPNEGLRLAASRAELERSMAEWRLDNPGATVAVLRPVVAVDRSRGRELRRSVWAMRRWSADDPGAPVQLLDLDDLAAAVDVAWRQKLDGPCNVAPDGWLDPADRDELVGRSLAFLTFPSWLRRLAGSIGKRTPDGLADYLEHPWVVANDRLESAGWSPTASTEDLMVALRGGRPRSARVRQELSLLALGSAVVALAVGVALLLKRRFRASR